MGDNRQIDLEKIAKEEESRRVNRVILGNDESVILYTEFSDLAINAKKACLALLVPEFRGYLQSSADIYHAFIRTEQDKILFYKNFNSYLQHKIDELKKLENLPINAAKTKNVAKTETEPKKIADLILVDSSNLPKQKLTEELYAAAGKTGLNQNTLSAILKYNKKIDYDLN